MVYFPNDDLCDGAAEAESHGFFDVYNAPPWDTWVAFVSESEDPNASYSEYLVDWVPQPFIGLAASAMLVSPEECIQWLDESGVSFAQVVEQEI